MKLDVLMKLVNLANKNPNDNEANLAARKVCSALGDGTFVIREVNPSPPPNHSFDEETPTTGRYRPYGFPYGGFGSRWAGYGQQRPKPEPEKPREKPREETPRYRTQENPNSRAEYRNPYDFGDIYEEFFRRNWKGPGASARARNESQVRTCTKCGLSVPTFNKAEPFVCVICRKE